MTPYELPPKFANVMRKHYGVTPLQALIGVWREDPEGALLKSGEDIEERILNAVRCRDVEFLETLVKAVQHEALPKLTAIEAVIRAFLTLFVPMVVECRKENWPTKRQVKMRAEEILRRDGLPIPSKRYWNQLFKQAGLSELPNAPSGRPKKLVH